ncbi:MAG: hypothetical protein IJT27_01515 [Clostridia bacterium]|nr:hypothetical protein [Clostridia bacterium]
MKRRKKIILKKRPLLVFAATGILFCALLLRIAYLQSGERAAVGAQADTRYIRLAESRGCIYDRNLQPLVNMPGQNRAAVLLSAETAALVRRYTDALRPTENETAAGVCFVFDTEEAVPQTAASVSVRLLERYAQKLCVHLIGYTDIDGKGVSGIEKAFDKILTDASGEVGVRYTVNGLGRAIAGEGLQIEARNYNSAAGVVLTIDKTVQQITQNALTDAGIRRGAAVVLDAKDSAILACVSLPAFDPDDPAASLQDADLPFLNRALEAYPVGSVFKPFIAVAAVENGVSVNGDFVCEGSLSVSGVSFGCYRRRVHGAEGLNEAVCNSCNTYFIDLGRRTGAEAILSVASAFGFGEKTALTGTLEAKGGTLPDAETLASPAALANLCFGQGSLLASPLQLAAAYAALANGGIYHAPYLMRALVDENKTAYAYYRNETVRRISDAGVCGVINEALRLNMAEGTGVQGSPSNVTSAGKTATAQTGKYDENGVEKLCTWFCGFVPFEDPAYVIVVFDEDGSSAAADCAPVFRKIAENIYKDETGE